MGQLVAVPKPAILAKQSDAAFVLQFTCQALEQGALARPVGAEQGGQGTALEGQIQPVEDPALAAAQAKLLTGQEGGGDKMIHSNPS